MNTLKTGILMAGLTALVMAIGYWIGSTNGMIYAFVLAAVMNFFSYWYSDKMVLAMTHAQEVGPAEAPQLYALVKRLTERDHLPMPRLYIVPDPTPNAFATGRDPEHAAVAVNRGLLEMLNEDELAGVLAHELSHVKHRDVLISTIAATLAGALVMLSRMAWWGMMLGGYGGGYDDRRRDDGGMNPIAALVMIIVAPIAAMIIQFAISRSREYAADEAGARLTGRPQNLANALLKLERISEQAVSPTATPATAHMYIVNPLHGGGMASLFSTHPPLEQRIARLEALARELGSTPRSSLATERGQF
jgi:heat shock protein HtpX